MNTNVNNDVLFKLFNAPNRASAQEMSLAQVARRCYFIGSIDIEGNFSIASKPAEQLTVQAAQVERNRLASTNPSKAYFVAQFQSAARVGGLNVY